MGLLELILVAIGLAMDAFAVSIAKGLSVRRAEPKHYLAVALWFGGFQALMPLIGYLLGVRFAGLVQSVDHWIAFILLALIGGNMIREALADMKEEKGTAAPGVTVLGSDVALEMGAGSAQDKDADFSPKTMVFLAIATSIDALAVGISMAFLGVNIVFAVIIIGIITALIAALGLAIGKTFGARYKAKAEVFGGIVLIAIGVKILVEHLFF